MKVAVGAPVGDDRAYILPHWFERIHAQTVRPDVFCFVASAGSVDVHDALIAGAGAVPRKTMLTTKPFYPRTARNDNPKDPHRARHFAALRNVLRTVFLRTDADVFLSLDTDVMLDDPQTIERLCAALGDGWDFASPICCLHPAGWDSHCYNAGWWRGGECGDKRRVWERATETDVLVRQSPVQVDIPMAAVAAKRFAAMMVTYREHECGEDCGYGDRIDAHGLRAAWLTDLRVEHIWDRRALDAYLERRTAAA